MELGEFKIERVARRRRRVGVGGAHHRENSRRRERGGEVEWWCDGRLLAGVHGGGRRRAGRWVQERPGSAGLELHILVTQRDWQSQVAANSETTMFIFVKILPIKNIPVIE